MIKEEPIILKSKPWMLIFVFFFPLQIRRLGVSQLEYLGFTN